MDLLDKRKSWDLLCKKVFGQDGRCPRELEDVGKRIANNCRGLPLSIVVIGGHLAKSPRTRNYWEYIVKNVSAVVNSEKNEHCLKILYLSYNHLPVHLKPCFLYMAIFSEDEEISVSQLIKLWVAEGFLEPITGKTMEEAGEEYLHDLVGRNLLLACRSSRRGKIKKCKIHDLLRDLCLKEASEKNFLCIVRKQWSGILRVSNNERRIVVRQSASNNKVINIFDGVINHFYGMVLLRSPALLHTMIFDGTLPSVVYKSLRVLSSVSGSLEIKRKNLVESVHNLVNIRCLCFSIDYSRNVFRQSIVSLWNLQSLAIDSFDIVYAPREIWKMSQLRHIDIRYLQLPAPPIEINGDILKNLQSAKRIINFSFSEGLVKRVPNIKKLKMSYDAGGCAFNNIARLEKLESFACRIHVVKPTITRNGGMLSNLTFPHSLKKLDIGCLHWDDVTTRIGPLPLLEVLILYNCRGHEWKLVEGHFIRLKYLQFTFGSLECFTADVNHFPCLEQLIMRNTSHLEEISSDIGDMPTLRSIQLWHCFDSAVLSAKGIADYQYENGNEELQIEVYLNMKSSLSAESLSASNFHVRHC